LISFPGTIVFQNGKRKDAEVGPLDKPSAKRVERVSENTSVSVEYAKSGRSTCKGSSENIAKGVLRLGASSHDLRGFDSTKWYHVVCFPASSYPASPVENLKGFDSIKVCFGIF
jgi:bifunctional polynucleotide phosphatase/kinase